MQNQQQQQTTTTTTAAAAATAADQTNSTPPMGPGPASPKLARPAPSFSSAMGLRRLFDEKKKLLVLSTLVANALNKNEQMGHALVHGKPRNEVELDELSVVPDWMACDVAAATTRGERQLVNLFMRKLKRIGLLRCVWRGTRRGHAGYMSTAEFFGHELNVGGEANSEKRVVIGHGDRAGEVRYHWRTCEKRRAL